MISSTPPWLLHDTRVLFSGVWWLLGRRVPGVLEQRLQHSIPVFRSELFLADHLRDHLLSNAFQSLLFTVKNHHTWLKVTESSYKQKNDNTFA